MAMTKRDKEWLTQLGLRLRGIASTLEGKPIGWFTKESAPIDLRKIAEALESPLKEAHNA